MWLPGTFTSNLGKMNQCVDLIKGGLKEIQNLLSHTLMVFCLLETVPIVLINNSLRPFLFHLVC